ncbi:cystatin-A-like [Chrysemys picta bellii]|uniref:cystatin-A-like n=1 Tax=Chrysemys picta bellii TaxID=8478 RepID=UPI0032B2769E
MSSEVPGGWSETLPCLHIQEIANKVKPQLEEKDKKPYPVFVAIQYRTQLVAGTNYLIKVSVSKSNDECVHLRVFQNLPYKKEEPSLTRYETGKTRDDPLEPF